MLNIKYNDESKFREAYLNKLPPQTLLGWLEDFVDQLDCPQPEPIADTMEYFKRIGAWETQMIILKKLKYAIKYEKEKNERT